jgi:hypothetical protein
MRLTGCIWPHFQIIRVVAVADGWYVLCTAVSQPCLLTCYGQCVVLHVTKQPPC